MSACCDDNKEYSIATKFYCCLYVIEQFEHQKRQRKWDNKPCLAYGTILSDKEMWNDILGCKKTYDETYQTPINNAWKKALQWLEEYLYNKHKIWRIVSAKAENTTTSELLKIKNNPFSLPEPKYILTFNICNNIEDKPKEFYAHYQQLAFTKEEQKQHLE
ncbi:hypothetical protein G9A89_000784 [Geosiphon pyriformis]|nr:hypothetical protein G9A89_000784 [Geosiphon pyriformis]